MTDGATSVTPHTSSNRRKHSHEQVAPVSKSSRQVGSKQQLASTQQAMATAHTLSLAAPTPARTNVSHKQRPRPKQEKNNSVRKI